VVRWLRPANRAGVHTDGAHHDDDDHRPRRLQGAPPVLSHHQEGLDGIGDGGHFFDLVAEKVMFEYITTPGYPRRWRDYLDPVAVFDALGWPSR
jgi:hypothetical protein